MDSRRWDEDVAVELATTYVDQDIAMSRRSADMGPVPIETAADTLWLHRHPDLPRPIPS